VTRIHVHAAAGRATLTLEGGSISPRVLRVSESGARVGLVATTALLLGGDQVGIDIVVGPGAWLELVETAGTVAYDAGGVGSSWTVRIRVAEGGTLSWAGEPLVVAHGANVRRDTRVELGEGAVACLRETLVLGRTGETGGAIGSTLSVTHHGRPLLVEQLDLAEPGLRRHPGMIGGARVIDTVCLLGMRAPAAPELPPGTRFDLDGPGTLARSITETLAASELSAVRVAWESAALRRVAAAAAAR